MACFNPSDFYIDDSSPEYIESMRKSQLIHAVCQDKKCCCNCKHLIDACVDLTGSDRSHWGKGGCWEHGYFLCGHPKVGPVFLGHQTDDNLLAKHGICPLYEVNDYFIKAYKPKDSDQFSSP